LVEAWGTGRKDYSANIEATVVPVARSYQVNAYAYTEFTLDAGEEKEIDIPMTFSEGSKNHFIFYICVTVDANVLIGVQIWSGGLEFISKQGYQKVEIWIPQGLGLSEVTLKVKNYSNISIKGAYSHNGVQGSEKIMPTPTV